MRLIGLLLLAATLPVLGQQAQLQTQPSSPKPLVTTAPGTTLAPEMKAYDFAQAYYIEDGGVVIVPYEHGFYCDKYVQTPEGIRIMPGATFRQYDPTRMVVDEYKLLYLNKEGTRAFFSQKSYRYKTEKLSKKEFRYIQQELIATNTFYLSKWRSLEWFDFAFPYMEIHPGAQNWRTRPQYQYR